jgi:hypothetical protein
VVEGLLVPEEDDLVPYGPRPLPHAELHELDGRAGGPPEEVLRGLVEVGAGVGIGLPRGELHGKGEAGGYPHSLQFFFGSIL